MKKLIDIFEPQKPEVQRDIVRIDQIIQSDLFLQGLGVFAKELKIPRGFPIVDNYLKAAEMLLSESIYSTPEPWPYQCFMEVWEEEDGRIQFSSSMSSDEGIRIDNYIEERRQKYDGDFTADMFEHMQFSYKKHRIKEFLLQTHPSLEGIEGWIMEDPEYIICNNFKNEIEGFIWRLIKTSFYIGLNNSSFYARIIEIFETGGIPAGWVGPTPENGGGKPVDCLQLLHYGV
jgi:hypothetical protein